MVCGCCTFLTSPLISNNQKLLTNRQEVTGHSQLMEILIWAALAILAWAASLVILRRLNAAKLHHPKPPPGPRPWPIIGNLNLIGPFPHLSFDKLSRTYGDIMFLKFGQRPVVVASSPTIAQEFLKKHDQTFCSRPSTAAGKYTAYNHSDMNWAPYGPHWRQARKIYVNELLSPKQLEKYEYIRVEERRAFVSRLSVCAGQEVVVRDHLTRLTLTNISRMALGNDYFHESGTTSTTSGVELKGLQVLLNELFLLIGMFNIGDWIPWLDFLDLQGYVKRMKSFAVKFDRFLSYVIDDHLNKEEEKEGFIAKDVVDVILQLAEDPSLEVKLSSDRVKGLIVDLIAAGTDTSAVTMEWAISELLKKPTILKKAAEELDRVIGRGRWVEEKDMSQLPYISAIVKETMRLHPVATLLVPHFSMEDCEVSGYDIPKGTTVFVNTWSIGRNLKYWPEPERFWPERFLGSDIDVKGMHFELLPFGSGRRMCPAYNLGLKIIQSTLANLIHGFELSLPENMKPEDVTMEEEYGLTTHRATPIVVVVNPRLPSHMY